MAVNEASVKFDSKAAERNVNSYAGKIGQLSTKLKEAKAEARSFGSATQAAGTRVTDAVRRAHNLAGAVKSMSSEMRKAASAMGRFNSTLNTAEMAKAAGVIRSLSTHLTTTSTRMKQIRASTISLNSSLKTFAKSATTAAHGIESLSKAADRAIPKLGQLLYYLNGITGAAKRNGAIKIVVTGMNNVGRAASDTANKVDRLNHSFRKGTPEARAYGRSISGLAGEMFTFGAAAVRARNVLVFLASGFGVAQTIQMADSYKMMQGRLATVTESAKEQTTVWNSLLKSANLTRTELQSNVNSYTRLAIAGKTYNISAAETLRMVENVNMALQLGGASAAESASTTQQLAQAFSAGRIQGDELKSVLENSSVLSQALTENLKDLGITAQNLRDKAKKGEIGIRELQKAFTGKSFTEKLVKDFEKFPVTVQGALTVLKNNLVDYIGRMDAASGTTDAMSKSIIWLAGNIDTVGASFAVAAGIIAISYVPALMGAIKASRTLAMLNLASYGLGVAQSMKAAGASAGLFGLAFKKSASSTAPYWRQVMGNLVSATTLSTGSMLTAFRTMFMRIPILAAIGAIAMKTFGNDTKATADGIATVSDYTVATLSYLFDKFTSFVGKLFGWIDTVITGVVDAVMWGLNQIYRGIKGVIQMGKDMWSSMTDGPTGGMFPIVDMVANGFNPATSFVKGYQTGDDIGTDVIQGLSSNSEIKKRAEARAASRKRRESDTIKEKGYFDPTKPDIPGKKEDGDGGKDSKDKTDKAAQEAERLKDSLRSLQGQLDETEGKRQEFEDGFKTLKDAMAAGLIGVAEWRQGLDNLAKKVFPGITDALKDLKEENEQLGLQNSGVDEFTRDFLKQARVIQEQIVQLDVLAEKTGDATGTLAKQRENLLKQLMEYGDETIIKKERSQQVKEAEEHKRQVTEIIDEASNKLYATLTDRLKDTLSLNKNMFKNFFKSILGMAKDTFASIIAANVFAPLQKKFRGAMEDAFGVERTNTGSAAGSQVAGSKGTLTDSIVNQTINAVGGKEDTGGSVNVPGVGKIELPPINVRTAANDNGSEIEVQGRPAKGFIAQVSSGYKQGWSSTWKEVKDVFKPVGKSLEKFANKTFGEGAGKAVGGMMAGAQQGAMVAGLGKMLGIKTSTTGGAIGGAIGSLFGPLGGMIGGALGGIVGGMFKKTLKASVNLSTGDFGNSQQSEAKGNSQSYRDAAEALGSGFRQNLEQISNTLGVGLTSNLNLGSIGQRKKKFTFDPTGAGRTKGSGVLKFKTEEEAIEAAVKNALKNGVLKGLSETSDRVVKTFKDTDRALQLVQTLEDVKRRAMLVKDPIGGSFKALQKDFDRVIDMFREMGASAADWADLQAVMDDEFQNTMASMTDSLKAFRDDLIGGDRSYKSPISKLRAADTAFAAMEADIAQGKFVDQGKFTDAGVTLQDLAREVYGSTPEFAAFQARLLAATDKLIVNADAEVEKYKPIVDALIKTASEAKEQVATTNNLLQDILEKMWGGNINLTSAATTARANF